MNASESKLNLLVYEGMRVDLITAFTTRKTGIAIRFRQVAERRSRELQAQNKYAAAERVLDGALKSFTERQ